MTKIAMKKMTMNKIQSVVFSTVLYYFDQISIAQDHHQEQIQQTINHKKHLMLAQK